MKHGNRHSRVGSIEIIAPQLRAGQRLHLDHAAAQTWHGARAEGSMRDLEIQGVASYEALLGTLQQRDYRIQSTDESFAAVAAASHKEPSDVLFAVMPTRDTPRAADH
jgi:hypothetical protein